MNKSEAIMILSQVSAEPYNFVEFETPDNPISRFDFDTPDYSIIEIPVSTVRNELRLTGWVCIYGETLHVGENIHHRDGKWRMSVPGEDTAWGANVTDEGECPIELAVSFMQAGI